MITDNIDVELMKMHKQLKSVTFMSYLSIKELEQAGLPSV
jgi:hypothetical protein